MLAPGEIIAANGSQYHVRRWGNNGPIIFLEAGLTMMSSCWGWLAPALAETNRVIAYDRAGLGWSDEREGLRDAGQIAAELKELWKALRIEEPVLLLGHSMGGMINRAFYRLNPTAVSAMIWLDPAHPDQLPRSRRMRAFFFLLEFAHSLAARNLPSITLQIVPHLKGLPERDYRAIKRFLKNPRHLRTSAREARGWKLSADHVAGVTLGDIPLLVLSAQKSALRNWRRYQQELAALSSRSRQVTFTEMSHLSMLANREHAARVAAEINDFVAKLRI
jgi:pimeloyl-ACP methyl ester carboxylesterase